MWKCLESCDLKAISSGNFSAENFWHQIFEFALYEGNLMKQTLTKYFQHNAKGIVNSYQDSDLLKDLWIIKLQQTDFKQASKRLTSKRTKNLEQL